MKPKESSDPVLAEHLCVLFLADVIERESSLTWAAAKVLAAKIVSELRFD